MRPCWKSGAGGIRISKGSFGLSLRGALLPALWTGSDEAISFTARRDCFAQSARNDGVAVQALGVTS